MSKHEFKTRWESDAAGDGITFDDIAIVAKEWGLFSRPKICDIEKVRYAVLKAANTNDHEEYNPANNDNNIEEAC